MGAENLNKLHIPGEADDTLKKLLKVSQELVDSIQKGKNQGETGKVTTELLEKLTKANIKGLEQLPHGASGAPAAMSIAQLEAMAVSNEKMLLAEIQKNGGAPVKINSTADLLKYSKIPPQEMVDDFEGEVDKEMDSKKPPATEPVEFDGDSDEDGMTPKGKYEDSSLGEFAEKLSNLLFLCKYSFHELSLDWPEIEPVEHQLAEHVEGLKEEDPEQVLPYMLELVEKIEEEQDSLMAAFVLTSIFNEKNGIFEVLIDFWQEHDELSPVLTKAFKFSQNPEVVNKLFQVFDKQPAPIQASIIEISDYHQDSEEFSKLLVKAEPVVQSSLIRKLINEGQAVDVTHFDTLLDDPEAPCFKSVLLTALIAGYKPALKICRDLCSEDAEKLQFAPIFLACSGDQQDLALLTPCFSFEKANQSFIRALGIFGMIEPVPDLIQILKPVDFTIEEHTSHKWVHETLELITGAQLNPDHPEINVGPKGEEEKIKITDDYFQIWSKWWKENEDYFDSQVRYRRGIPLANPGDLIHELEYPGGNYWSRQYASCELMIRSGHKFRFEADWYVKEQLLAIEELRLWWRENKRSFEESPWLFAKA